MRQRQDLWQHALAAVRSELPLLDSRRRTWVGAAVANIARWQEQIHALYLAADGPALCCRCRGACCACGTYHFTLVNLLAYLIENEEPPAPDFQKTCPFLGPSGCLLPVARRPFNCVIFLCDQILDNLTEMQQRQARLLEDRLRRQYLEFENYFAGASLRGLLIRAERLGGQSLLAPPEG